MSPRALDRDRRLPPSGPSPRAGRRALIGALTLATAAALVACAPAVRGTWTRPGVDAREQQRDEYECARQATFAAPADPARAAAFAECMRARGYQPLRDR
jgi:hypothetical protein